MHPRADGRLGCTVTVDHLDRQLVAGPDGGAGQRQLLGPGERPVPVDPHRIGHDVTIGRYLTAETLRLSLSGLVAGLGGGLAWRAIGRRRWGGLPFVLAVLAAARHTGRSDWFTLDRRTTVAAVVLILAGAGTVLLLKDRTVRWEAVAAGSLMSAAGVWAGVPETGPALLVGGALTGLSAAAVVTRCRWAPTGGAGAVAILGWAAVSGAAGRPWAMVGGALCTGVAPWLIVGRLIPASARLRLRRGWLLPAHLAVVVLAARWIGVNPHAGWVRVGVLAAAGTAVAATTQRKAS